METPNYEGRVRVEEGPLPGAKREYSENYWVGFRRRGSAGKKIKRKGGKTGSWKKLKRVDY